MSHSRLLVASSLMAVCVAPASAHIVLSQPAFEVGQNYAAFFKIDDGCNGSPTTQLKIDMPESVIVLDTPEKPGWTLTADRVALKVPVHTERGEIKQRMTSVTWRGHLDAKKAGQFGLFVKLPDRTGPLYFPAVQHCEKGEVRWTGIPVRGQALKDIAHPAPMLELTAAKAPAMPGMDMSGSLTIEQPWSPATPPGATTGAAYLTIVNHGAAADTLIGGSTPVAASVQIHQMSMANGVMSMREMKGGLPIAAGATVLVDPAQPYHLMLVGLKQPLKRGARFPITLTFAKAGRVQAQFSVAAIGARAPDSSSNAAPGMNMPGMDHR